MREIKTMSLLIIIINVIGVHSYYFIISYNLRFLGKLPYIQNKEKADIFQLWEISYDRIKQHESKIENGDFK